MTTQTRAALKHDKFVDTTHAGLGWFSEHRRQTFTWAGVLVLIVALIIALSAYQRHREEVASTAFGQAMATYGAPLQNAQQPVPPNTTSFPTVVARAKAANQQFLDIANRYGSTKDGKTARYFAGLTAIEMNDNAAAEKNLKEAADHGSRDLSSLARLALASLYHQTGRDSQAIATYKELISKPSSTVSANLAKLQLADLYNLTDPAQARKLYAEVKDSDKNGAAGQIAATKLNGSPSGSPSLQ